MCIGAWGHGVVVVDKALLDHRGRPRVVITGMGMVSPLGHSPEQHWDGVAAGRSGIDHIVSFDAGTYPCRIAGEVRGFDARDYMDFKEVKRLARFSRLAVAAARQALTQSGLPLGTENETEVGVYLGTGVGGLDVSEAECRVMISRGGNRVSPFFGPSFLANMATANVARLFGARGYNNTCITACAAGTQAIGEAAEVIRRGVATAMLAGGAESCICELGLACFAAIRALTTNNGEPARASRPFDVNRDGFVAAEGAGVLVLEELGHALRRDAPILGEVVGFGVTNDGYHLVMPSPEGRGASQTMRAALRDAGLRPEEIGYINAHGTSTPLNDVTETKAIKQVFGEYAYRLPISSTKSMIGHALGAAGALEAITCIMSLRAGVVHPTINLETPDPECDLDYVPNTARKVDFRYALSNSFGFGGQNASLILARYDD